MPLAQELDIAMVCECHLESLTRSMEVLISRLTQGYLHPQSGSLKVKCQLKVKSTLQGQMNISRSNQCLKVKYIFQGQTQVIVD